VDAPDLSRDRIVVAWDVRASDSRRTSTTPGGRAFADALAAFITSLGLDRSHLVGPLRSDRPERRTCEVPLQDAFAFLATCPGSLAESAPTELADRVMEVPLEGLPRSRAASARLTRICRSGAVRVDGSPSLSW
jgi:hypothetical protein